MSVFDDAKEEVGKLDDGICQWSYGGRVYEIPLLNGDVQAQKNLLDIADKYDEGVSGLPSEIAKILGDFMYELLILRNNVTRIDAQKMANKKSIEQVFGIWLGL